MRTNKLLTVEEIVQSISHSFIPLVLCEGETDIVVMRVLEEKLGAGRFAITQCFGRDNLLQVYERRDEFTGKVVCFVADQDFWIFSGIPKQYEEILFWSGYSIESDLLKDSHVFNLMTVSEKNKFNVALKMFSDWFSSELGRFFAGDDTVLAAHPLSILTKDLGKIRDVIADNMIDTPDVKKIRERIKSDSLKYVRGKSVMSLIACILSSEKRKSKYSYYNLIEISLINNQTIETVFDRIQNKIV